MTIIAALFLIVIFYLVLRKYWGKNKWRKPQEPFRPEWRIILVENVAFYNALSKEEKARFEFKVQEFLLNCRITGIDTDVDVLDELLVASSAVIPIFEFIEWKYINLHEVLVYPGMFNDKFETSGPDRRILGMVGSGYMEGKMILSKERRLS